VDRGKVIRRVGRNPVPGVITLALAVTFSAFHGGGATALSDRSRGADSRSRTVIDQQMVGDDGPFARGLDPVGQVGGDAAAVAVEGGTVLLGIGLRVVSVDVSEPALPVRLAGSEVFPGEVRDIEVRGGVAYVAIATYGIAILDVTDPRHISTLAMLETWNAQAVHLVSDRLLVADGSEGLVVILVADPRAPITLGSYPTQGEAVGVSAMGEFAVVTTIYTPGVEIIDLSDPASPRMAGNYKFRTNAHDVEIDGHLAYVAGGDDGVLVLDLTDPIAPVDVAHLDTWGYARDVSLDGSLLALADGEGGLRLIDVSDPTAPMLVTRLERSGSADRVTVSEGMAYALYGQSVLEIVDVRDPRGPHVVRSVAMQDHFSETIRFRGDIAVVGGSSGVRILDVSQPLAPLELATIQEPKFANAIEFSGDLVFVGYDYGGGLLIIDVADPRVPRGIARYQVTGPRASIEAIEVVDPYAYFVSDTGFTILDVSDPTSPRSKAVYDVSSAYTLAVHGRWAYIGTARDVQVWDVVDPAAATPVARLDAEYPRATMVEGNHLYYTDVDGLHVVDVSDPRRPTETGFVPGWFGRLDIRDGLAFSATTSYLYVHDLRDPRAPVLTASVELPAPDPTTDAGHARDAVVHGQYAFIPFPSFDPRDAPLSCLVIVDIASPSEPVPLGTLRASFGQAHAVRAFGGRAYVGGPGHLTVVSAASPDRPTVVASVSVTDAVRIVDGAGTGLYAVTTHGVDGGWKSLLRRFDVGDPDLPRQTGTMSLPEGVSDVAVAGDYLYAGIGDALLVLQVAGAGPMREVGRYKAGARVSRLDVSGGRAHLQTDAATVEIVDLADPRAPRLLSSHGPLRAGTTHTRAWDILVDGPLEYSVWEDGFEIFDVSDASHPIGIGRFDMREYLRSDLPVRIALLGKAAVLASSGYWFVVDVTDPTVPVLRERLLTGGNAMDLDVSAGMVFLASDEGGLTVWARAGEPGEVVLPAVYVGMP
jgi:hypothetical protein